MEKKNKKKQKTKKLTHAKAFMFHYQKKIRENNILPYLNFIRQY